MTTRVKGDGSPCQRAWDWFDAKEFAKRSDLDNYLAEKGEVLNTYMEECVDAYPWEPEEEEFTTKQAYELEPLRPHSSIRRDLQELVKKRKLKMVRRGVYRRIDSKPPRKENLATALFRLILGRFM